MRRSAWVVAAAVCLLGLGVRPALARQAKVNPHGTLPDSLECSACHTDEGWVPLRTTLRFEHGARSGFVLSGAHTQVPCAGCHLDLHFDGPEVKADDCSACHADVHEGRMTQACTTCHTTRSFDQVDGEAVHARTSFPLTGAHRQVTCESCHVDDVGGAFTALPTDCVACHQPDYSGAQTIDHVSAGYPTDCTRCHSTLGWGDAPAFDHAAASGGFTLLGAHTGLRCASCHATPGMAPLFPAATQDDCVACHRADYDREHGGSAFPTTCLSCHTVDTWDDADFDHALTGFQLQGRHANLECAACHAPGSRDLRFPAPSGQDDCVVCHQADYDHEHAGSGFPTTCLSCHNQQRWEGASFDHATTGFALVGAHEPAPCADCHGEPAQLSALPSGPEDCVACHQPDYDGAHGGSDFPVTCIECHTQASWEGATFDHVAIANGFALEGPHATAACTSCHSVPDYGLLFPTPSSQDDCAVCHQADYDGAHGGSSFPTTCLDCHVPDTWSGATIDHGAIGNGFALDGPHATAACTDRATRCRTTGSSSRLPRAGRLRGLPPGGLRPASTRARASRRRVSTVTHRAPGRGPRWTTSRCRAASTSWGPTPRRPARPATRCPTTRCSSRRRRTQNDCVACHQAEYDREHAGSGFPTTCLDCHASNTWSGATVDHVSISGGFDLLGAHATATCTACHSIPDYGLLFPTPAGQNDCVACHQTDYDGAHAGSGYPTDCAACHTVSAWQPSTFDHDAPVLPDLLGRAPGRWSSCNDCHLGGNLSSFTCTTAACHSKSETDGHHGEVRDYVYEDGACLSCHPRGRAG